MKEIMEREVILEKLREITLIPFFKRKEIFKVAKTTVE